LRGLEVCAVQAPGYGDSRTSNLQDLAVLTGAQLISEEAGIKLEEVELSHLGKAKKINVSKDDTIVLGGGGEKKDIEERCNQIRDALNSKTASDYDKEKLQERLAKLSGGVGVIKVGGASEIEVNEKKDRVTDALNATRAAVAEGIVPGGGCALLYASKALETLKRDTKAKNFDQGQGVQIIQDVLKVPARTIANNSGVEGSVVVEKLLEKDNFTYGFDAQTGKYVDMIKAGIIDPLKVVRTALVDAASVASLMTTTEAMIYDLPKRSSGNSGRHAHGGGGGGMGDVDF